MSHLSGKVFVGIERIRKTYSATRRHSSVVISAFPQATPTVNHNRLCRATRRDFHNSYGEALRTPRVTQFALLLTRTPTGQINKFSPDVPPVAYSRWLPPIDY